MCLSPSTKAQRCCSAPRYVTRRGFPKQVWPRVLSSSCLSLHLDLVSNSSLHGDYASCWEGYGVPMSFWTGRHAYDLLFLVHKCRDSHDRFEDLTEEAVELAISVTTVRCAQRCRGVLKASPSSEMARISIKEYSRSSSSEPVPSRRSLRRTGWSA